MLDERRLKAIELLVENRHNKSEIAKIIGVSRTSLYDWLSESEFVTELDNCVQKIKVAGENAIKANVTTYVNELHKLALKAESENVRLDSLKYLVDRVLGKTSSKLEVTTNKEEDDNRISDEQIQQLDAIDLEPVDEDVKKNEE